MKTRLRGIAAANRALAEAQQIAERGPMPLFLADVHLHRARLWQQSGPHNRSAAKVASRRMSVAKPSPARYRTATRCRKDDCAGHFKGSHSAEAPAASSGLAGFVFPLAQLILIVASGAAIWQGGAAGVDAGEPGTDELGGEVFAIGKEDEGVVAAAVVHALPFGAEGEGLVGEQMLGEGLRLLADSEYLGLCQAAEIPCLIGESVAIEVVALFLGAVGEVEAELVGLAVVIEMKAVAIIVGMRMPAGVEDNFKDFDGLLGSRGGAIMDVTPDLEADADECEQDPAPCTGTTQSDGPPPAHAPGLTQQSGN